MPNVILIDAKYQDWDISTIKINFNLKYLYIYNIKTLYFNIKSLKLLKLYGDTYTKKYDIIKKTYNNFKNNNENSFKLKLLFCSSVCLNSLYSPILLILNHNTLKYVELNGCFYEKLSILLKNECILFPKLIGLKLIIRNTNHLNYININTKKLKYLILKFDMILNKYNNMYNFLKKLKFNKLCVLKLEYDYLMLWGINLLFFNHFYELINYKFCFICESQNNSHTHNIVQLYSDIDKKIKKKKKKFCININIHDYFSGFGKIIGDSAIDLFEEYKYFNNFLNNKYF